MLERKGVTMADEVNEEVNEEEVNEFQDVFEENAESDETDANPPPKTPSETDNNSTSANSEAEDSEDADEDQDIEDSDNDTEDEEDDASEEDSDDQDAISKLEEKSKQLEEAQKKIEQLEQKEDPEPIEFEKVDIDSVIEGLEDEDKEAVNEMFGDFPELKTLLKAIADKSNQVKKPVEKEDDSKKSDNAKKGEESKEPKKTEYTQEELEDSRFWTELITKRPDAETVASSEEFNNWLNKQSASIQRMSNTNNVDDAVMILNAYDASVKKAEENKQAKAERATSKKNLHKSTINSKGKGKKQEIDKDDFESAFYSS